MHAIQRYQYDRLQKCLHQLQKQSVIFKLPEDHLNTIVEQEKTLKQLYNNYQAALQKVSLLIKQYDQENQAVRRLISKHKQYTKQLDKKFQKKILKEDASYIASPKMKTTQSVY